jgi:hypothetical protein
MSSENYLGGQPEKVRTGVIVLPHWLIQAVEQKNPRVTLDLAYSVLLVYDDLDKKLLPISALN